MQSTVSAISTPNSAGGIGIIKISGPKALEIADRLFKCVSGEKLSSLSGYSVRFGHIESEGRRLDRAVAVVYRAPKSYTGEDVAELQCHGGLFLMQQVLRLSFENGASPAAPGEFTKRAFLNEKLSLNEAEAVMSLISARGKQAADAALNLLEGSLSREIKKISALLLSASAGLAVWADYPDEDLEESDPKKLLFELKEARERLMTLIEGFDAGQAVTEGVETVIAGKPNVGKSTLMNLLLRKNRAIVTEFAGTTRDVIEETARVGNSVLRLSDTAGIRSSENPVEAIGIEFAKKKLSRSALILAVFDGSAALDAEDMRILKACGGKNSIAVINKKDLGCVADVALINKYVSKSVIISAKNWESTDNLQEKDGKTGLSAENNAVFSENSREILTKAIEELLGTEDFDSSAALLANERQLDCCKKSLSCVDEAIFALTEGLTMDAVNASTDAALTPLLELTGEKVSDAVVDEIFSRFCVGK